MAQSLHGVEKKGSMMRWWTNAAFRRFGIRHAAPLLLLAAAGCSSGGSGGDDGGDEPSDDEMLEESSGSLQPDSGSTDTGGAEDTDAVETDEDVAETSATDEDGADTDAEQDEAGDDEPGGSEEAATDEAEPESSGDQDGDTISDEQEGEADEVDSDDDGIPDYLDEDSDDDGIPDAVEAGDAQLSTAPRDTDNDGIPDFQDTDADDDGIDDELEAADTWDVDGDLKPNYLDTDSDNDDISDAEELELGMDPFSPDSDGDSISDGDDGLDDSDGDGVINALDEDSDDDGFPDLAEVSDSLVGTKPDDSDLDGTPDFLDLDSDQDGLPDAQEKDCGDGRSGRLAYDADEDGFDDLAETLLGSDACSAQDTVLDTGVEFYFVLPFEGAEQSATLRFVPQVKQADVMFNVDTTGSMGEEVSNLAAGLNTIVDGTRERVSDAAFGLSTFRDFQSDAEPFVVESPITTDAEQVELAVNALTVGGGGDFAESGYEALYQLSVGDGVDGIFGVHGPWAVDGAIGGAQFRMGSLPIIVHATDATSHDSSTYAAGSGTHSAAEAYDALLSIGARVITIESGTAGATTQLQEISQTTNAVVPVCAFKTGDDSWRCGEDTCCDGTIAVDDRCVLRYEVASNGAGLSDASADGIDALIKYTTFDLFALDRDDGDTATPDTSDFIVRVEANTPDDTFKPPSEPEFSCNPVPNPAMLNGANYENGFEGFAVGSSRQDVEGAKLFFTVRAQNTTVRQTGTPQLFTAFIDIVDETTGAVLDTQDVVVIVPASVGAAGE